MMLMISPKNSSARTKNIIQLAKLSRHILQYRSFIVCWITLLLPFLLAVIAQATDFRKLDEAIPSPFIAKIAPVFDFDNDGCLPSAGISRRGEKNGGLKVAGNITGECRSRNFLDTSNTIHRHTCVKEGGAIYCGHFFALYFEKDQVFPGPDLTGRIGHRHDWEHAAIWTKNGVITHGGASAHGQLINRPASEIFFENGHMKIVYHKDEGLGGGTHAMRFATRNDNRAENPYHRFVTPTIVSWDNLHGDSLDNQTMRSKLNRFNYGKAVLPCTDQKFYYNLNRFKPSNYPTFYITSSPTFEPDRTSCQWISGLSEENKGVWQCPSGYLLRGIKCNGRYCDRKDLLCCPYKDSADTDRFISWSPWISEEKIGYGTAQGFVGGIQCSGRYCDNIRLQFIKTIHIRNVGNEYSTVWFSEERPNNIGQCSEGEYVTGLRCSGRYCDNIKITCGKAAGPGDPKYRPNEWMGNRWR
jgi:hypothetical protein